MRRLDFRARALAPLFFILQAISVVVLQELQKSDLANGISPSLSEQRAPREEEEEEGCCCSPRHHLFFPAFFSPIRAGCGCFTRIRMSPNSRQSSGFPPRTAERQSAFSSSLSSLSPLTLLPQLLTTTGFTSRTLAERSHAYLSSPGHSGVAPLKLGSLRLRRGPTNSSLEVRGSAGSSRLQIKFPPPPPPPPPAPPRLRLLLLQIPPPPRSSSFLTTTTEHFSSRGCHQHEDDREKREDREREEEELSGCEKSNASLEEGDAGEVTVMPSRAPAAAAAAAAEEKEEEETEENDAAAEGNPQDLLPCDRASALLTSTLAAQAAETGGSHAIPASATSSSKAPQGESS